MVGNAFEPRAAGRGASIGRQKATAEEFHGHHGDQNGFSRRALEVEILAFEDIIEDAKIVARALRDPHRLRKLDAIHQQLSPIFDQLHSRVSNRHISVETHLLLPLAQIFGLAEEDLQDLNPLVTYLPDSEDEMPTARSVDVTARDVKVLRVRATLLPDITDDEEDDRISEQKRNDKSELVEDESS